MRDWHAYYGKMERLGLSLTARRLAAFLNIASPEYRDDWF
jgi:hypothetical protein